MINKIKEQTNRIAIIDIGTHSILYLLATLDNQNKLITFHQETTSVRLGRVLHQNGAIQETSCRKAVEVINHYKQLAISQMARNIIATGTQVFRTAENSSQIIQKIQDQTALPIEILSEEKEAKWSYMGAKYGKTIEEPSIVADVGGGSTEIVLGKENQIEDWTSFNIGAVVLTEKYIQHDPPLKEEIVEIESVINSKLDSSTKTMLQKGQCLIAVGGTATTLAALDLNLKKYQADVVDGYVLDQLQIKKFIDQFLKSSVKEKRKQLYPDPERADIILAGTLILNCLLKIGNFEKMTISDHGLRYGIALREFQKYKNKQE
jgi:exopolyphosphatase/guanosine-5'-triphosphate,3'-diphosphate pyrophosphatase